MKTNLAPTAPMGWNSWNTFGAQITEADVRSLLRKDEHALRDRIGVRVGRPHVVDRLLDGPTGCGRSKDQLVLVNLRRARARAQVEDRESALRGEPDGAFEVGALQALRAVSESEHRPTTPTRLP